MRALRAMWFFPPRVQPVDVFTDANSLGVAIRGVPSPHLLFEWVLTYSRWTYVTLAVSETFEATLRTRLDAGATCGYASVQSEVRPPVPTVPVMHIPRPDVAC